MDRLATFEGLTNLEVYKRYRLDHDGITHLDNLIGQQIAPKNVDARNLRSIEKILATLRYLASGEFQINDADIHFVSQSTVSRAVGQVTDLLSGLQLQNRYINFPLTPRQVQINKEDFNGIANFPNVIGVIDGTQVQIKAPHHEEDLYVNRNGYHSINTQIIFDGQERVIDVCARWPGSTHDSRILRESGVFQLFERGHVPTDLHGYLLGDSGYPCKTWLLTPYLNPAPGAQSRYNRAHKRTRSRVEMGIGQVKRRWGILNGCVRLRPDKVCRVIVACAVLHNVCKERGIQMIDDDQVNQDVIQPQQAYNGQQNGLRYRDLISNTFF